MSRNEDLSLERLRDVLGDLPLGEIHYFSAVESTNTTAAEISARGAPDATVVIADEQTAGRGRQGRTWITRPGAALAVSVILRPESFPEGSDHQITPGRYSGLGGLITVEALHDRCRLPGRVKWPNDILLQNVKVGGVLVESSWTADTLTEVILGIGLNVREDALPPGADLRFPAGTLAGIAGREINRLELLQGLLEQLIDWRRRLFTGAFLEAWERALAFRGQQVVLSQDGREIAAGVLVGLAENGSIKLQTGRREPQEFPVGEIQLRPVDRS